MSKAEQIYHEIGEGYGFNGDKEAAIEIINKILDRRDPIKLLSTESIAKSIQDGVTYSHQTNSVVIHGAIDSILKQHYKAIDLLDEQFNHLVEQCGVLSKAGCKHDLHVINKWVNKYTNDDGTINWRLILHDGGFRQRL